jgi:hypothetical protein
MLELERPRGNVEVVASRRRASRSRAPRQLWLGALDSTFPRCQHLLLSGECESIFMRLGARIDD